MLSLSPPCIPTPTRLLLESLERGDFGLFAHGMRVGRIAARVGVRMGLSEESNHLLEAAGQLHDIGKLSVPYALVHKEGTVTPKEYQIFQHHPELGGALLEECQQPPELVDTARQHHERWDGRGYPLGLCGNEITLFAQITALADAYDAMVSGRSYRSMLGHSEALEEIQRCRGSHFSPAVVEAFLAAEFYQAP